ncbi:hypothetical protein HJFPF1_05722 [Paramyrothecium foliicola]|nr:hypothetical protein HJFPF1_05722 [Paramyrothecium foliicola]
MTAKNPVNLRLFVRVCLKILTFSYSGAYNYHTLNPITDIAHIVNGVEDRIEVIRALSRFRQLKDEELSFVTKAATLSAAAVVGIFSWPATEKTLWVAKMLWNWSFFLSTFALISSAHQRLLRHLPKKEEKDCQVEFSDEKIKLALNLFLQPPPHPTKLPTKNSPEPQHRRISIKMLWVWQCPTMLMSYSWVLFLVGYALHVLTPVFDSSHSEISSKVAIITRLETTKMTQSLSTTIQGPNGPLQIVCGEATPDQWAPCLEVAGAAFVPQLPPSIVVEHGKALSHHALLRDKGVRFWCVSVADDPLSVLAMCGTLRRPLLVRDSQSVREEDGYCIYMVATHSQYRRLGLANMVLKKVTEWLDGESGAAASMLYTSIGDFYVRLGWEMIPSVASIITSSTGSFCVGDRTDLPSSRLLADDEIPHLCHRDVKDLKHKFEEATVAIDEVQLAVIPSPDMINYLHFWGDVLNLKIRNKSSEIHGAICEAADAWIYWHHSLDKLVITRVRTPPDGTQGSPEALASLLLHALEEAQKWDLPKITIWEPSNEVLGALEIIERNPGVEVQTGPRPNSITSLNLARDQ